MPCNNICCPPHFFNADRDPLPSDCQDTPVVGYVGGFCKGSYWYNEENNKLWIGANDMPCNNALWLNFTPETIALAHVRAHLTTWSALGAGYPVYTTGVESTLIFTDEEYDTTSNYDPLTGIFVAPRDGYYLVSLHTQPDTSGSGNHSGWNLADTIIQSVWVNGVKIGDLGVTQFMHSSGESQVFANIITTGSTTVKLNIGDTALFKLFHNNVANLRFNGWNSYMTIDELPTLGVII